MRRRNQRWHDVTSSATPNTAGRVDPGELVHEPLVGARLPWADSTALMIRSQSGMARFGCHAIFRAIPPALIVPANNVVAFGLVHWETSPVIGA